MALAQDTGSKKRRAKDLHRFSRHPKRGRERRVGGEGAFSVSEPVILSEGQESVSGRRIPKQRSRLVEGAGIKSIQHYPLGILRSPHADARPLLRIPVPKRLAEDTLLFLILHKSIYQDVNLNLPTAIDLFFYHHTNPALIENFPKIVH